MAENAPMEVDSPATKQPRFQVKKWNAVCLWSWDIVVDNCAICRNHIMDLWLSNYRGMHRRVGPVQPRLPFPLHLALAQDQTGLPTRQQRMGTPKVRPMSIKAFPCIRSKLHSMYSSSPPPPQLSCCSSHLISNLGHRLTSVSRSRLA